MELLWAASRGLAMIAISLEPKGAGNGFNADSMLGVFPVLIHYTQSAILIRHNKDIDMPGSKV